MKMQACTGGCKFIVIYCGKKVSALEKKIRIALRGLAKEFAVFCSIETANLRSNSNY